MIIEKTFHVHQPLQETRTRLGNLMAYRRQFDGVTKADFTAEGAQLAFEPGLGCSVEVDLSEMESHDPDCILFRSHRGNVKAGGMIEFFAVRENLTEVTLTVDYQLDNALARVVDSIGGVIDRFLNTQLRCLQAHFEGVGSFASRSHAPVSSLGVLQPSA